MRLQALEGWRGLAAVFVIVFHLYVAHSLFQQEWLRWSAPMLDFFFVLSGFVMALGFRDRIVDAPSFWSFWIRRAGRLWPMHLLMLGLLLLIPLVRVLLGTPGEPFSGKLDVAALPAQVTLTQIWFPGQALSWNHPAWTLSAEIPCYLLMTFVCLIARRAVTRWLLSLAFIAVSLIPFLQALDLTAAPYNVASIPRAALGFFIGFLLYDLWRWTPHPSGVVGAILATVLEIAALAGFVGILIFHFAGPLYLLNHLACAAMVFVFARDQGLLSKLVSTAPFLWLGKVSLSVYMFHGVVTTWLMLVANFIQARVELQFMTVIPVAGIGDLYGIDLPQQWMNDALLAGYLVFVLAAAQVFYSVVEVPARDLFNRWARQVQGSKPSPKPSGEASHPSGGVSA